MDRPPRRPRAALGGGHAAASAIVTAASLALVWGAMAADGDPPVRALHWIARDADTVRAVSTQPTECLNRPTDPALALKVEVGRAAFRTPVLLGARRRGPA